MSDSDTFLPQPVDNFAITVTQSNSTALTEYFGQEPSLENPIVLRGQDALNFYEDIHQNENIRDLIIDVDFEIVDDDGKEFHESALININENRERGLAASFYDNFIEPTYQSLKEHLNNAFDYTKNLFKNCYNYFKNKEIEPDFTTPSMWQDANNNQRPRAVELEDFVVAEFIKGDEILTLDNPQQKLGYENNYNTIAQQLDTAARYLEHNPNESIEVNLLPPPTDKTLPAVKFNLTGDMLAKANNNAALLYEQIAKNFANNEAVLLPLKSELNAMEYEKQNKLINVPEFAEQYKQNFVLVGKPYGHGFVMVDDPAKENTQTNKDTTAKEPATKEKTQTAKEPAAKESTQITEDDPVKESTQISEDAPAKEPAAKESTQITEDDPEKTGIQVTQDTQEKNLEDEKAKQGKPDREVIPVDMHGKYEPSKTEITEDPQTKDAVEIREDAPVKESTQISEDTPAKEPAAKESTQITEDAPVKEQAAKEPAQPSQAAPAAAAPAANNGVIDIKDLKVITTSPPVVQNAPNSDQQMLVFKAADDRFDPPKTYTIKYFSNSEQKIQDMKELVKNVGTPLLVQGISRSSDQKTIFAKSVTKDLERTKAMLEQGKQNREKEQKAKEPSKAPEGKQR